MKLPTSDLFNELFVANRKQIRKIAASLKRKFPASPLGVTTLYHETYLKMSRDTSDLDILVKSVTTIRSLLVDDARRRNAAKRGGGVTLVGWDERLQPVSTNDRWNVALDDALKQLALDDPAKARLVELHIFVGLTWPQVAQAMGVSLSQVERDWKFVRSHLLNQMSRETGGQ